MHVMGPTLCCLLLTSLVAGQAHHLNKRSPYKGYGSRGCLDLRSKRYISDGFCTTVRPVAEAVCVARCQEPSMDTIDQVISDSSTAVQQQQVEWRCTQGATRRKMVRFLCRDGTRRVYQIRLVTKCNCKKVHIDASSNKHSKSSRKMKRL